MDIYKIFVQIMWIPFLFMIRVYDHMSYDSFVPKRREKRRKRGTIRRRLICNAMVVYAATARNTITAFDTDSHTVGVDNRASACFSHVAQDFVGELKDCNKVVKGFGGSNTSNVKMGTLKLAWLDDEGKMHTHYIPRSYFCAAGGSDCSPHKKFPKQQKMSRAQAQPRMARPLAYIGVKTNTS